MQPRVCTCCSQLVHKLAGTKNRFPPWSGQQDESESYPERNLRRFRHCSLVQRERDRTGLEARK
jgi:hypothetical protein